MKKNENGRSMIEMLGVLAIIGVLSVGGIYGYTTAMKKYKANEIVQAASMLAARAHGAAGGEGGDVFENSEKPGGVTTVTMKACKPCGDVSQVLVGITGTVNATDDNNTSGVLCTAINAIAPHEKTADTATRAGYYITCGKDAIAANTTCAACS